MPIGHIFPPRNPKPFTPIGAADCDELSYPGKLIGSREGDHAAYAVLANCGMRAIGGTPESDQPAPLPARLLSLSPRLRCQTDDTVKQAGML
jgi:hypothetical protein